MKFKHKIIQLTKGSGKTLSWLSEKSGVKPGTLGNYINRGSEPTAPSALKLSRSLGVSTDWLIDDEAGFPPPSPSQGGAGKLSNDELMLEVCRRYRTAGVRFYDDLERAKKIDWAAVAGMVLSLGFAEPIPDEIRSEVQLFMSLSSGYSTMIQFDPDRVAGEFKREIPGETIGPEELMANSLREKEVALTRENLGYRAFKDAYSLREFHALSPRGNDMLEEHRKRILAELDVAKAKKDRPDQAGIKASRCDGAGPVNEVRRDQGDSNANAKLPASANADIEPRSHTRRSAKRPRAKK